jgi:predicted nucleic acid-binding protein
VRIFVDTSAWYAVYDRADGNHKIASQWYFRNSIPLFTTDFIVDETLTLLQSRGKTNAALAFGDEIFNLKIATLHYVSPGEIRAAWQRFQKVSVDKAWSFTDSTSKVIIDRPKLDQAFAFDHHFRQFGKIRVVP